jgi:drug/metabolite transporter (DMT)-like permease
MKKELKGTIELVVAAFCYSLLGPFFRIINEGFGPFAQNFVRGIFVVVLCFFITYLKGDLKKIANKDYKYFLITAVSTFGTITTYFIASNHLALGTAIFLFYSAVVVVNYLLGYLLFKEKITNIKVISLVLAILGLYFVLDIEQFSLVYSLLAVISGVFFALYNSFGKKLRNDYSSAFINMVDYIFLFLSTGILTVLLKDRISFDVVSQPWIMNFLLAFIVVIAIIFVIDGFRHIEAQKGSLILLLEVMFVVLIGVLFYDEQLDWQIIIGGIFVIISMILPIVERKPEM